MTQETSARHTEILDNYLRGNSRFKTWADEKLGDLELISWKWGILKMEWVIDDRFVMPDGVMFGGHVSSVADHILGLTAMTVLADDGERFRTSKLETNFFRPIKLPKSVIEGRAVNVSRSLIHVEADFLNPEGKLCARVAATQVRVQA